MAATEGGVSLYRFYDSEGALLYVGITEVGAMRWNQHRKSKHWWSDVASTTVEHFRTRPEALEAEKQAIIAERPIHNVVHNREVTRATTPRTSGLEPVATFPDLDTRWMASDLRRRTDALAIAIDDFLHAWQEEVPDEDPLSTILAITELLSVSDCCPQCRLDQRPVPPQSFDDGVATYVCPECGTDWTCWWANDVDAIRANR